MEVSGSQKRVKRIVNDDDDEDVANNEVKSTIKDDSRKSVMRQESVVGERISFPRHMFQVSKDDGPQNVDPLIGTCEAWSSTRKAFLVVFDEPFEESFDKFSATASSREDASPGADGGDKRSNSAKRKTITLSRLSVAIWNDPDKYLSYDAGEHSAFGGSCTIRKGSIQRRSCCWWAAWVPDHEYRGRGTKLEDMPVYCVCFRTEDAEPPPPLTSEQTAEADPEKSVLASCDSCEEWFHTECAVMVSSQRQSLGGSGAPPHSQPSSRRDSASMDIESAEHWKCPLCDGSIDVPRPTVAEDSSVQGTDPVLKARVLAWKSHSLAKQPVWRNPLTEWQWWSHGPASEADGEWVFALATLRRFVNRKGVDEASVGRTDPASKAILDVLNRGYINEQEVDPEAEEAAFLFEVDELRKENVSTSETGGPVGLTIPRAESGIFTRSSSPSSQFENGSFSRPVDLHPQQALACSRTRSVEMHMALIRKRKRKERKKALVTAAASTSSANQQPSGSNTQFDEGRNQRLETRRIASAVGESALTIGRRRQLRFGRSNIHMWGVFAEEPISAGEFVAEYMGELITQKETDRRFAEYMSKGMSDYLFRIDDNLICDATMKGSIARFINHSCEPNCEAKIVTHQNQKKIALYALRDIIVGEELCYDYKFPIEEGADNKIPCNCGAKRCRKVMN